MGLGGLPRKEFLPKTGRLKATTDEKGGLEHPGINGSVNPTLAASGQT
jgi:hypothetical protein